MATRDGEPVKILLAEDDEDDRELFKAALKEVKPEVKVEMVDDGQKLMSYLTSTDEAHPDIIFLDINMPCKDGIQCLKEIRGNKKLDDVPVIMFSTSNQG